MDEIDRLTPEQLGITESDCVPDDYWNKTQHEHHVGIANCVMVRALFKLRETLAREFPDQLADFSDIDHPPMFPIGQVYPDYHCAWSQRYVTRETDEELEEIAKEMAAEILDKMKELNFEAYSLADGGAQAIGDWYPAEMQRGPLQKRITVYLSVRAGKRKQKEVTE